MAEVVDQKEANKALYIAGFVILLVVASLFTNGFGLFDKGENPPGDGLIKLEIGSAPVLGEATAPVTIYEFSDFSCPYCAAAAGTPGHTINALQLQNTKWEAPLPAIKEKYVANGKVKIVFKYFPGHGTGTQAHFVAWCLQDQGLFWKFYGLAFAQQANTGSLSKMKKLADTLGANLTQLDACLSSDKYITLLQRDAAMGRSNGVKGTPAFFINGKLITGAESFDVFEREIEKVLS